MRAGWGGGCRGWPRGWSWGLHVWRWGGGWWVCMNAIKEPACWFAMLAVAMSANMAGRSQMQVVIVLAWALDSVRDATPSAGADCARPEDIAVDR